MGLCPRLYYNEKTESTRLCELCFGASVHNGLICNYSEFKTFEIPSEICAIVALVSLRTMLCVSDFNLMLNGLIIMVKASRLLRNTTRYFAINLFLLIRTKPDTFFFVSDFIRHQKSSNLPEKALYSSDAYKLLCVNI